MRLVFSALSQSNSSRNAGCDGCCEKGVPGRGPVGTKRGGAGRLKGRLMAWFDRVKEHLGEKGRLSGVLMEVVFAFICDTF